MAAPASEKGSDIGPILDMNSAASLASFPMLLNELKASTRISLQPAFSRISKILSSYMENIPGSSSPEASAIPGIFWPPEPVPKSRDCYFYRTNRCKRDVLRVSWRFESRRMLSPGPRRTSPRIGCMPDQTLRKGIHIPERRFPQKQRVTDASTALSFASADHRLGKIQHGCSRWDLADQPSSGWLFRAAADFSARSPF